MKAILQPQLPHKEHSLDRQERRLPARHSHARLLRRDDVVSQRAFAQETAVTRVDLPLGRAYPYRAAEVITRVTVANPAIVDAVVVSEREIVINAAAAGEGDIILWLQSGAGCISACRFTRQRTACRSRWRSRSPKFDAMHSANWASRRYTATRTFALGWELRQRRYDRPDNRQGHDPVASRFLTVLTDFGTDDLLAFLEAQEQNGKAHLLAEPTIMTANREPATFLAGGECQSRLCRAAVAGPGGQSSVTVQFREFGIRLKFTPEIVSDSLIKLQVTPEVSEPRLHERCFAARASAFRRCVRVESRDR